MDEIYVAAEVSASGAWRVSTIRVFNSKKELISFLIDNDSDYKVAAAYKDRKPRILRKATIEKMRTMESLFDE